MSRDNKLSIYLFLVLLTMQSGMQLPFFSFMRGDSKIIIAFLLLIIGFVLFYKKKNLLSHYLGLKTFWSIVIAFILSIICANIYWKQEYITSILLYRQNIWILFLPLLLYIKPSYKSISNALFALTMTALIVWIGQVIGIIPVTLRVSIWGEVIDDINEFGGYSMNAARFVTFSLYLFLYELGIKFSKKNLLKVLITSITVILTTQRALIFIALPIIAYTFLFKIRIRINYKILVSILFLIIFSIFILQTIDIWISLFEETTQQIDNKNYNRWMAIDYFINKYNTSIFTSILGNGFLSLHNAGGQALYNIGFKGIFIDDIGMMGVWVRYGIIPVIILYYIVIKVLSSKQMPLYMKFICFHIGILPTAWTLIGHHTFIFVFLIYLYCLNIDIIHSKPKFIKNT